jgi:excisionase family DNA binding protein
MSDNETISPKEAAMLAGVHSIHVYAAIQRGLLRARKSRGRVLIQRDSFEGWRKRLEIKRDIRKQERELLGA